MKFPECTVVSINLPNALLEIIDTRATQRIINRSACVRELVTEALRDPEFLKPSLPKCKQHTSSPLSPESLASFPAELREEDETPAHINTIAQEKGELDASNENTSATSTRIYE